MRILFIYPPNGGFDRLQWPTLTFLISRVPPIGSITLAAYLRKHGHETGVVDGNRIALQFGNVRTQTYEEMIRKVRLFKPELVAITMLTAGFYECRETVTLIRRVLPNTTIVAGGPHPSGEPVATLEQIPELDGIGIGPGETILLDLANGRPLSETPGCAYLKEGKVVFVNGKHIVKDIDFIPFPAWDLIDMSYYSELNSATTFGFLTRSLGVLTSRGCPGNCYFCSSEWNRPLRMHSVEYVLDMCTYLTDTYPIDTIAFWDDTMAAVPGRLDEICEGLLQRGLHRRIKWRAHLRADQVNLDLLKLMKKAGCFYVAFGAESGSDRILKLLNKGTKVDENLSAAELIKRAGLFLGISVIMGVPTETENEMQATIDFCKKIDPDSIGVGRFCPLPGSPSYTELVKNGRINPKDTDWELLGNFSAVDGPCFSEVKEATFRRILIGFMNFCYYYSNLDRYASNNKDRYPEIVRLCSQFLKQQQTKQRLSENLQRYALLTVLKFAKKVVLSL